MDILKFTNLDLRIEGRKYCFSIFFLWLQSIKSVHKTGAKLKKYSIFDV
jgi:hypothetical protein